MSKTDEIEKLLERLTRGEKAELLERVARDLGDAFPGIDQSPDVCGGAACITRTLIAVWVLESARRQGATDVELLRSYPALRAEDLAHAWAYVRGHRDEIDREIRENEAA